MVPLRQERPYHSDSTASRLLSEVKHCRARLVLRWGATLESLVLFFCSCCLLFWPLPTIRYIIALYPPSSFLLLGFCSAERFSSICRRSKMKPSTRLSTSTGPLFALLSQVQCFSRRVQSAEIMRLAPGRFESIVNLSLHLYQTAMQRR